MCEEALVQEARRRRRIFENLSFYLDKLKAVIGRMDEQAEIYLFGSVAEDRYVLSSDIDILILTRRGPAEVLAELWRHGIQDPFEIHVQPPQNLGLYRNAKLVRIM